MKYNPLTRIIFLIILCFLYCKEVSSQITDLRGGGAINVGTARFYNYFKDLGGIYGNFASTSMSKQTFMLDLSAILRYHDASFGEYSLAAVKKIQLNSFGLLLAQFGSQDYFERKLQFSYARQIFTNGGIGVNFNVMNIQNAEWGNSIHPTIDFSFYSVINKKLSLGTTLLNILKINNESITYPQILSLALFYHPSNTVTFGIEASKIADRNLDFKLMINYLPAKFLTLHLGVDMLNHNIGFGIIYSINRYKIGAATGQSTRLPMSSGMSFSFVN